jgi:hypothetical protein
MIFSALPAIWVSSSGVRTRGRRTVGGSLASGTTFRRIFAAKTKHASPITRARSRKIRHQRRRFAASYRNGTGAGALFKRVPPPPDIGGDRCGIKSETKMAFVEFAKKTGRAVGLTAAIVAAVSFSVAPGTAYAQRGQGGGGHGGGGHGGGGWHGGGGGWHGGGHRGGGWGWGAAGIGLGILGGAAIANSYYGYPYSYGYGYPYDYYGGGYGYGGGYAPYYGSGYGY